MVFYSVFAFCGFVPAAGQTDPINLPVMRSYRDGGKIELRVKNTSSEPLVAIMVQVRHTNKATGKLESEGYFPSDAVVSKMAQRYAPGAEWTSPLYGGDNESATGSATVCAVIFESGEASGTKQCIDYLLNKRRIVLRTTQAAYDLILEGQRQNWSRDQLIAHLDEIRASNPLQIARNEPGSKDGATLSWVRSNLRLPENETGYAETLRLLRLHLEDQLKSLNASKPRL